MLSHLEIENRIKLGDIQVRYSFLPNDAGVITFYPDEQNVIIDSPESAATRFFRAKLFSDRLGITLGPIVRVHDSIIYSDRIWYKGKEGYIDIRETNNILYIEPHEAISIASNERIILGSNTSVLIIPRIKNADAGILLNVAYIDPFWDGTLQMIITNVTSHRVKLSLLESIGQCVFFNVEGEVEQRFKEAFPAKSHHFGQNWKKIIEEDADPFPRRKEPEPARVLSKSKRFQIWLSKHWKENQPIITGLGLIGLVMSFLITQAQLKQRIEDFEKVSSDISYLKKLGTDKIPALERSLSNINDKLPIVGIQRLIIPAGKQSDRREIVIDRDLSKTSTAWLQLDPPIENVRVSYALSTANPVNKTLLEISVQTSVLQPKDTPVNVRWMLTE